MTYARGSLVAALLLLTVMGAVVAVRSSDPAVMLILLAGIALATAAAVAHPRRARVLLRIVAVVTMFLGVISLFSVGAPLLLAITLMLFASDKRGRQT